MFAIRLSTLISVSLSRPPPSIPFTSLPPSISFTSIPPSISYFASTPITGCTCSSFTVNSSSMEILLLLDFCSKEAKARATDNWKTLQELEKAAQVYWNAKDRKPPRFATFICKISNIEGTGAVQMIPHFFYNAKRPAFVNKDARRTV
ncbi:Thioredoxin-like fold domain-containing protein MRL7 homolog, chloroplastic [Linum perenne]